MKEGDKFIHTNIIGNKEHLTYSGTRREIKGVEFELFYNDNVKGEICFFTDTEVEKLEKVN